MHAAARSGGGRHGPAAGLAGNGPVRGYPPDPGQPPPVYPPGQFSAWNQVPRQPDNGYPATRQGAAGWAAADYPEAQAADSAEPWYPEPGYARQAVSEPPAGETWASETWAGQTRAGETWAGQTRAGETWAGQTRAGETWAGQPGYAEPASAVLAVSDPAADGTSTQSWETVDASLAAGSWATSSAPVAEPRRPPVAEPPRAGRSGHGRTDTGGRQYQAAQPGSGGQPAETGRQAAPQRGPAARTERPHPRRAHARARSGKRAGRLLIACALVVALTSGSAAYLWFSAGQHGAGQAAAAAKSPAAGNGQPQSAAPAATPPLGRWGHIQNRTADPLPLTLTELFPAAFTAAGSGYARTVERGGTDCAKAVIGSALQSAVRLGRCTQVMRASYLSHDSRLMGTIGVLNLASMVAAERSGKAAGGGDFIAQLAAAKGPTRQLTRGTGLEETEIKGHFLVMVWAEFASLDAPTARWQRQELETFCNRLFQNTANLSLASRMITGKPRTP